MANILTNLFGSRNQRLLKRLSKKVSAINKLEPEIQSLSDEALKSKTEEFRKRLREGVPLDDLLIEAFAVVREVSQRTLKMRPFDVQLIGGIVLHQGKIAESGTHDELIAMDGRYSILFNQQGIAEGL